MEKELMKIMSRFYKIEKQRLHEAFIRRIQKEYLEKDYVQEALKNKYSSVYVVAKLKLNLNHYGEIIQSKRYKS